MDQPEKVLTMYDCPHSPLSLLPNGLNRVKKAIKASTSKETVNTVKLYKREGETTLKLKRKSCNAAKA